MIDLLNPEQIKNILALASLVVTCIVGIKLKEIIDVLEWHRTKKEMYVEKMLKIPELDASTREALVEQLNYVVYRKLKRISADKFTRERVNFLMEQSNGEIKDFQIYRAWKYVILRDKKLLVEITAGHRIANILERVLGVVFLTMAYWSLFVTVTAKELASVDRIYLLSVFCLFFIGAMYYAWQNIPISIAKKNCTYSI
jgi:hypothetical protein